MRVLHVAESAKGGVGTYLATLLPSQVEALGDDGVRVIVPAEHRAQIASAPDALVRTFPRAARSASSLAALSLAVAGEARRMRPDVIHAHSTFAGLVVRALFAAAPWRPRLVYCPHGWGFDVEAAAWKTRAVVAMERRMARACDRVVAVSRHEAARAHAVGIDPRRVRLVMSGLPEAPPVAPAPWRDGRRKVLFVGRLDPQKGVDVLYDAVRPLGETVSVRVVGDGVAEGIDLQAPANVSATGWLDAAGVAAQVAAADVVAIPSRWEGFGLVALEAMRAGKAVVATRVGGLPELVADGETGRLTPPDRPDLLRAALMTDTPAALAAMGARGRVRFAAHFTAARMNAELLGLYAHVRRTERRVRLFPAASAAAAPS